MKLAELRSVVSLGSTSCIYSVQYDGKKCRFAAGLSLSFDDYAKSPPFNNLRFSRRFLPF